MDNLNEYLKKYNIILSDIQIEQFNKYYEILIETNKKFNLTSITERNEVIIKHFFDSLAPSFFMKLSNQKVVDIGAGAGFPSIPLKICYPDLDMTLIDSLNKRINFLNTVIEELNLTKINCCHGRAEELAKRPDFRERYDIVLSRAVARTNVLCELSLPFVKVNGKMIALKGANVSEELIEAKKPIQLLGGEVYKIEYLELPQDNGKRNIIFINKIKNTPKKYPRKPGEPSRNPII